MTDTERDGWPEEYHDPRDRPHPDVLRVTVEGFEAVDGKALDTAEAASDEDRPAAVVSFATVDDMWEALSDRRIELLEELINISGEAESVSTLAERLGRDHRPVQDDVALLSEYGLLFVVEGRGPYVPYEQIRIVLEVAGGPLGEGTKELDKRSAEVRDDECLTFEEHANRRD